MKAWERNVVCCILRVNAWEPLGRLCILLNLWEWDFHVSTHQPQYLYIQGDDRALIYHVGDDRARFQGRRGVVNVLCGTFDPPAGGDVMTIVAFALKRNAVVGQSLAPCPSANVYRVCQDESHVPSRVHMRELHMID
jgi:hypothetical protein